MRNQLRLWGFLFAILLLACSCNCGTSSREADVDKADSLVVGDHLPQFSVKMNDGTTVSTDQLVGQPSVVMFFTVGCIDCRHELPQIQRLYEMQTGVPIVLISRECIDEDIRPFWEFNGFTMPYSAQADRRVYSLFAPSRIPRIYVSDAAAVIRYAYADNVLPTAQDLLDNINQLKNISQ